MKIKTLCKVVGWICALVGLLAALGPISAQEAEVPAGLNGDGYLGLVVGVPGETVESAAGAGAVNVLYGVAGGLSAAGSQQWHQDSPGIEGTAETNDRLGASLAAGDFNGDGYVDLAVGVPNEMVQGSAYAGAANVLYGSAGGLSAAGNQVWHQDSAGIAGEAAPNDGLGYALAAGDLNGDGHVDLAVGVPNETVEGSAYAGAVNVLYGSVNGLSAAGNQYWHQDSPGIAGEADVLDTFGYALAIADLNGDGYADLAVGVPGESANGVVRAGAVNVLYGSAGGLSAAGSQQWHQDSPGMAGEAEAGDFFGDALAAGDLNGDGYADLVVGVPYEDVASATDAGAVNVLYGSAGGLSAAGNQYWHQDSAGIADFAEGNDGFGRALAGGDLNGDGYADLVVGVPGEEVGTIKRAGAVNVLYGSAGGLSAAANQMWHQDSPDVADAAEESDSFGVALAAGDLNGDGYADLAIGVPLEKIEGAIRAGAVNVLHGSADGLSAAGNQIWHQNSADVAGTAGVGDAFGAALVAFGQARHRVYLPVALR